MANDNKVTFVIDAIGNAQSKLEQITQATSVANTTVNKFTQNIQKIRDVGFAFQTISSAIGGVTDALSGCQDLYNIQSQAETRLETVMRQRTGATDEQINSIKELASAQQQLGIIGDEVQLSGAQQLATFINQKDSIETLLPAMNNLLAQQRGINASEGDAVNIGNLMGKVMQGQTAALTRVGVTFTEAQEQVLKYGTEQQRAAMLAQVITDNVGNMNEALAGTPEGQLKQVSNAVGDMKERIGALWVHLQSEFLPIVAKTMNIVQSLLGWLEEHRAIVTVFAIGISAVVAVIKGWIIVQGILNTVMALNPIGILIAGAIALVGIIVYLCSKITGWGSLWKGVVGFMKYSFFAFVDAIKLYFNTYINGFLIGLDKIKLGWYKFKEAAGLGDSGENQSAIAQINADVEARQKAIVNGAKAVADNAKKAKESLGSIEMGWNGGEKASASAGVKAKLGINDKLQTAVSGTSAGAGASSSATGTATEAVATGGTKSTTVNIRIDNMIREITYNGGAGENAKDLERVFAENLNRVLGMAGV